MAKLIDLLGNLVKKSGGNIEDAALKALFARTDVSTAELPDELSNKIEQNLLTREAAASDPQLSSTIKAQIYNGIDSEIDHTSDEYQLDDATKALIKQEKSTNKKIPILVKQIQALEAKKHEGKALDKEGLTTKINELNTKLSETIKSHNEQVAQINTQHETEITGYAIENNLNGYNYIFPKEVPTEVKIATAKSTIDAALLQKGLKVIREGKVLKLVKQDGTEYFDQNHNRVSFSEFTKTALDTSKLLANSAAVPGANGKTHEVITPVNGAKVNPAMQEAIKLSRQEAGLTSAQ